MSSRNYINIVDLLTDEEWSGICTSFGLSYLTKALFKAEPDKLFSRVSKTSYATAILGKLSPLVVMLQDIMTILQQHGVHARTTNSIVVLSSPTDELDLTQQQFDLISSWSKDALAAVAGKTWSALEAMLKDEVRPVLDEFGSSAKPQARRRRESFIKVAMRSQVRGYPQQQRKWTEVSYHQESLDEYEAAIGSLRDAIPPSQEADPDQNSFVERLESLVQDHEQLHREYVNEIREADKQQYSRARMPVEEAMREAITRFIERLKFMADWERSDEFGDLLQIDIFRHRPQLYEMWVLSKILSTLASGGFQVYLLEIVDDGDGGKRWELKYAKASRPIARMTRSGSDELFLFYQLFRNRAGGDMPDISMWGDSAATGNAIWVIDPKFSEKGGYSASDYKTTAERYRQKFSPQAFSTIVEYFARPDISVPMSGAILDVRPDGAGTPILVDYLRRAHNLPRPLVAVVDVSGSFLEKLPAVASELAARESAGLEDQYIAFAHEANVRTGLLAAMQSQAEGFKSIAGGGTELAPLLAAMRQVEAQRGPGVRFVIFSDFQFSDGSQADITSCGLNVEAVAL